MHRHLPICLHAGQLPSWGFLRNFVGAQLRISKPAVTMPNPILAK